MGETEAFWSGEFGTEYQRRNTGRVAANVAFFKRVLRRVPVAIDSVVELGAGMGENLTALRTMLPDLEFAAVEINASAVAALHNNQADVYPVSLIGWRPPRTWTLAFTKGVLIHIPPADLPAVYDALVAASSRYVLIAEYYNPTPVEVPYRGHAGRLWKRDFASELIERHELALVDYGFTWRCDPYAPQDDITWFLMEKRGERK